MEQELISVIVAIYKVEEYLNRCIESIVQQTYKNLEIILVDDGSPDKCPEICEHWKEKDSRIRVIHKKNGGLSDARNAGMKVATGKYIAFVDADDWLDSKIYETLYQTMIENGCSVAICDFQSDDNTKRKCEEKRKVYGGLEFLERITDKKYPQITYSVWKCLYKVEIVKNIRFLEGRYYEDVPFSTEVYLKVDKVAYINEPLYYYTIRNTSITKTTTTDKHIEDMLIVLDLQKELIEKRCGELPLWVKEQYFWQCVDLKLRSLSLEQKRYWLKLINEKIDGMEITFVHMKEKTLKNYVKYVMSRYMIYVYSFILRLIKEQ